MAYPHPKIYLCNSAKSPPTLVTFSHFFSTPLTWYIAIQRLCKTCLSKGKRFNSKVSSKTEPLGRRGTIGCNIGSWTSPKWYLFTLRWTSGDYTTSKTSRIKPLKESGFTIFFPLKGKTLSLCSFCWKSHLQHKISHKSSTNSSQNQLKKKKHSAPSRLPGKLHQNAWYTPRSHHSSREQNFSVQKRIEKFMIPINWGRCNF